MANDFSADSTCKAVWRFEASPGITADSKGTNTLTNNGGVSLDNTIYMEGASSALFSGTNFFTINDSSLSSGFPLKNGDTTKTGTYCCWYQPNYIMGDCPIMGKLDIGDNIGSLHMRIYLSGLSILWMNTNIVIEGMGIASPTLVVNQRYHIAVVFDGVNKTLKARIYDANAATSYNTTATMTLPMNVDTTMFSIGSDYWSSGRFSGNIDEAVVFTSMKSDSDIDKIRNGVFGQASIPASSAGGMFSVF